MTNEFFKWYRSGPKKTIDDFNNLNTINEIDILKTFDEPCQLSHPELLSSIGLNVRIILFNGNFNNIQAVSIYRYNNSLTTKRRDIENVLGHFVHISLLFTFLVSILNNKLLGGGQINTRP